MPVTDAYVGIAFTNTGSVNADLVRFRVDLGVERIFIPEYGTFSPGTTIRALFRRGDPNVQLLPGIADVQLGPSGVKYACHLESVHFTNGTSWSAPSS